MRRGTWVAAFFYLAIAVWALRVLLPAPASTYPLTASTPRSALGDADQSLMIWAATRNAHTLVTRPWRLLDWDQCYPTPYASGLDHPLLDTGLLAIPAYVLGANPILTLNLVGLATMWLSALAMFGLARYWTASEAAALVAGLAFGFHPSRIAGASWPGIWGNQRSPLALLFTHRLFARGRWRDAAGVMVFLGLQVLGSFYQLLPLVVMGAAYATYLAGVYRRRLRALLPKVLAVVAGTTVCAAIQFAPYVYARVVWGDVTGHGALPAPLSDFARGRPAFPGTLMLGLAALGLIDRVRRGRRQTGEDPRYIYLGLALLALWTVSNPDLGIRFPSLLNLLARVLPGLDAVRGLPFGSMGVYLPCALLAAYGARTIVDLAGPRRTPVVAAALVVAILSEVFVPRLAGESFGRDVELRAEEIAPPRGLTAFYRDTIAGAVLDLPVGNPLGGFRRRGHALLLAAFHAHPIAACYTTYDSPLTAEIEQLATRLPDARAADALFALGFETLVVHGDLLGPFTQDALARLRTPPDAAARITAVGMGPEHWAFRLHSPVGVTEDWAALVPVADDTPAQIVAAGAAEVAFRFRNGTETTYRHPDPIEPTRVVLRWYRTDGSPVAEQVMRLLLPIALAAGEQQVRSLRLAVPSLPARYRVTCSRAAERERVLAVAQVEVQH